MSCGISVSIPENFEIQNELVLFVRFYAKTTTAVQGRSSHKMTCDGIFDVPPIQRKMRSQEPGCSTVCACRPSRRRRLKPNPTTGICTSTCSTKKSNDTVSLILVQEKYILRTRGALP